MTDEPATSASSDAVGKLMSGLRQEYESFFQPLYPELYNPEVAFQDPLIALSGVDAYQKNVDMLAGVNPLGRLCFTDCGLTMHNVTRTAEGGLCTRWTLQFRFRLLPWAPLAQFTGVSEYTLDSECRVLFQQDYWDSINLERGRYAPVSKLAALADFVGQLAPQSRGPAAAANPLPHILLRRAAKYEVRRYDAFDAVNTQYVKRIDGFDRLTAYARGSNEAGSAVGTRTPSLIDVPADERTLEQVKDDVLNEKWSDSVKVMRWPLDAAEAAPPRPAGWLDAYAGLERVRPRVVAALSFAEPTTEQTVRGYAAVLTEALFADGLLPSRDVPPFQLAQYDALNSNGACDSEVWIELETHPW